MMLPLNTLDFLASRPFRELRALPANHLRLRIGTDQRIVFGHVDHITRSYGFWLQMAAARLVQPGSTVLDIGCGCGRTAQVLRDAYWRNRPFFAGTYIGVDVDGEAIAWCTDHFPSDRFRFHRLDMFSSVYNPTGATQQPDLPVDPASVDLVLCLSLFTHLLEPDVNYYLRQIRRVLRPGGAAYVTFFCIDHLRDSLGGRFTFRHRRGQALIESPEYPEAAVAYEEGFLRDMMSEVGFDEITIEPAEPEIEAIQTSIIMRQSGLPKASSE